MTPGRSGEADGISPFAGIPERPSCPRCQGILALDHTGDPEGLCSPCRATVDSCRPFAGILPQCVPEALTGPAPAGVNVLELAAGLLLTHDALHPGQRLDLRGALAAYGVELDNSDAHNLVSKLRRRHGIEASGVPLERGYVVEDWVVVERRVYESPRTGQTVMFDQPRERRRMRSSLRSA